MGSAALLVWKSDRATRLNRLLAAHRAVRGTVRGRRWVTDELNHSLILRLATEFQGYARELHDETSLAVVGALAPGNVVRQNTLQIPYSAARRLDRGNAEPNRLNADFGLFGLQLWVELDQRYPTKAPKWRKDLTVLNTARNGLAHDDVQKIANVVASGWPLTLPYVRRWRATLDGLTVGMDQVVGHYIHRTFGVQPW